MRVLHVQGKKLVEINKRNGSFEFLNGDVYIIDNSDVSAGLKKKVFIWLGSQAYADDRAVGAWAAKQLDLADKEIDIDTEVEGNESAEFKGLLEFVVVTGDTPGFLKHVEVNKEDISYALYRVRDTDLSDGSSSDDITIEKVPLKRESFISDDVFVVDAYHDLYVWVGAGSQIGEKVAGNRVARKLDVDRDRTPMVYQIGEGYEPEGFWDLFDSISGSGLSRKDDSSVISASMSGSLSDLTAPTEPVTPPAELAPPPSSSTPREIVGPPKEETYVPKPPPIRDEPKSAPKPAPTPVQTSLGVAATAPVPTRQTQYTLYYVDGEFTEVGGNETATLEINESTKTAVLSYGEGSSLITQRTAGRQARGICKAGFAVKAGYRIGIKCDLQEVRGEEDMEQRVQRYREEGRKYV
ncbi:MAG: hypothetical protein ACW99R_12855 [Candidatus Hodarchaeales archaeon]|jgi:hypothetical protein